MYRTNILFLFLFSCILHISCKKNNPSTTTSNVHLNSGLLLYFPFTGNIADSSGNYYSVQTIGNVSLTMDQHQNPNSAFNASQGRLVVTNNGLIKFDTAFTISFNFKSNAYGLQCYLSLVDNVTGYGPTFSLGNTIPNDNHFGFNVQNSSGTCGYYGSPSNSNTDAVQFIPQLGTWYNMICIYHNGTVQVYKNGSLISTQPSAGTSALLCPNSKFMIGGWWNSDPETMNGVIDEVRLYNRVLNTDEIAQLYKNFQ